MAKVTLIGLRPMELSAADVECIEATKALPSKTPSDLSIKEKDLTIWLKENEIVKQIQGEL
jgi:hypothetical protein